MRAATLPAIKNDYCDTENRSPVQRRAVGGEARVAAEPDLQARKQWPPTSCFLRSWSVAQLIE